MIHRSLCPLPNALNESNQLNQSNQSNQPNQFNQFNKLNRFNQFSRENSMQFLHERPLKVAHRFQRTGHSSRRRDGRPGKSRCLDFSDNKPPCQSVSKIPFTVFYSSLTVYHSLSTIHRSLRSLLNVPNELNDLNQLNRFTRLNPENSIQSLHERPSIRFTTRLC
jgi:hypothetical protein